MILNTYTSTLIYIVDEDNPEVHRSVLFRSQYPSLGSVCVNTCKYARHVVIIYVSISVVSL